MSTARELSQFASAITVDANNHIEFNSTYTVAMNGLNMPAADGTSGQLLTTDGSGNLSFTTASGGISNLVEDTTPQLGGNLDVNSKTIDMSGTARIAAFSGDDVVIDSYGASGNAGDIRLSTYSEGGDRGNVIIDGLKHPTSDGTNGQVLTTDGSGNLSFTTAASGGISNVVEDTTPQLGGNLDINSFDIITGPNSGEFKIKSGDGTNSGYTQFWPEAGALNLYPDTNVGSRITLYRGVSDHHGNVSVNAAGDLELYSHTGVITFGQYSDTYSFPTTRGTAGQVLTTDGAGALTFEDAASGGGVDVVSTTTIDNPNPYGSAAFDQFGQNVAISGNYAIVATTAEDDAGGSNAGKAYLLDATTGSVLYTLHNPNAYNTSLNDFFGSSVAIDGNYAIVGAYGESDAGGSNSGKAYIYDISTFPPAPTSTISSATYVLDNPTPVGTSDSDRFGESVAISGNYAIVGAKDEDDSNSGSGKAYIYNVTTGSLVRQLNNPTAYSTSSGDNFGASVSISGNYAIVGAPWEDDAGGVQSGKAYIFDVTTGNLFQTLGNPNPYSTSTNDEFGRAVAISGNYAIVGAGLEDDAGGTTSGKAYIFDVTTGTLLHTLDNPNAYDTSADDYFGAKVAISGNYAIVGAQQEDDAGGNTSGKVYIFDVTDGALVYTLDNPNAYSTSDGDFFGISVGISGNRVIASATGEDDGLGSFSGKAYIFELALPFTKVADDITPKLGGDLDTKGFSITSTGDPDPILGFPLVKINNGLDLENGLMTAYDGAGSLHIDTKNPVMYLRSEGDYSSTYPAGFFAQTGNSQANASFSILGTVNFANYSFPYSDGTAGQVLTTDGSGNLSFAAASGGISNLVEDTTPQLGGTLDTNGNNIGSGSSNIGFYTSGYGGVSGNLIVTNTSNKLYLQRGQLILTDTGDAPLYIKANDNMTAGASGWTMTMPAGPGTNGQVLTTDGTGNLSFADAGGASPFTDTSVFAQQYIMSTLFR